jgi:hypothetical protein
VRDRSGCHVVLYDLGIGTADLIAALCGAGISVTVVEADASDAARVDAILRRLLPEQRFAMSLQIPMACDLLLCGAADAPLAPKGAIVGLTDGPRGLRSTARPDRTVALDCLDPVFVEVAFGAAAPEHQSRVLDLLKTIGADVVASDLADAFAGTLLQDAVIAMVDRLLLVGVTPWELDEALEAAGFITGFLKMQDRIGLDVAFARRRADDVTLLVADRMVREGRLGRSVGVGWYRYPGGGGAVIDPLMEDMVTEEAHFARIKPLPLTDTEAAEALILGVINAGATLCADAGLTAHDLDRIAFHKLGLPDLSGRARQIGASVLADRLTDLQRIDAGLWRPSGHLALIA